MKIHAPFSLSLLVGAAVLALGGSSVMAQQSPATAPTAQTPKAADPARGARNDTGGSTFVKKAATTDMAEIEMAKLALEKSQNANVRQFAQHMIDEHSKLSEQ